MASQIIQTLVTELTANGAQMRDELNRTMAETQSWGARIGGISKKIGVGIAVAGAGAAVGLGSMVKSSIDAADELSKLSQKVGVEIGELSRLAHAADLSDVSLEALGGGLKKFSKNVIEAAEGTGAQADAFKALDINLKNADGSLKNTDQLFYEVADSLSRLDDGATKTALSMEFFGKSGADLIPLLNSGRQGIKDAGDELQRMGGVLDTETGLAAERFNDNITRLETSLKSMGTVIAKDVTEPLADMTDVFADPEVQEGIASMAAALVEFGTWAVKAAAGLGDLGKEVGEYFARMQGYTDGGNIDHLRERMVELNDALSFADGAFLTDNLKEKFTAERKIVESQIKFYEDSLKKIDAWQEDDPFGLPESSKRFQENNNETDKLQRKLAAQKEREAALKTLQAEQKKLNDLVLSETAAMKEKLALGSEATELQKMQYRLANGDLKDISAPQKMNFESLASELDTKDQAKRQEEQRLENEKLVASAKDRFDQIHAAALQSEEQFVELENFRHQREQEDLQKELDFLREKGAATAEVEDQFRTAKEEQEKIHVAELKKIQDEAILADYERKDLQLANAQDLFSNLTSLTAAFGGKNSRLYKAMFAVEKAIGISRSIMAIQTGIAMAAANPFPANLAAMATVATATAGIVADIEGTQSGIAHGGLDYVPKESTYLLDKGERVLSPKQNTDLTNYLKAPDADKYMQGSGGVNVTIQNFGSAKNYSVEKLSETDVRIIARDEAMQVVQKETSNLVSRDLADPNSRVSKSLSRNTQTQRSR